MCCLVHNGMAKPSRSDPRFRSALDVAAPTSFPASRSARGREAICVNSTAPFDHSSISRSFCSSSAIFALARFKNSSSAIRESKSRYLSNCISSSTRSFLWAITRTKHRCHIHTTTTLGKMFDPAGEFATDRSRREQIFEWMLESRFRSVTVS